MQEEHDGTSTNPFRLIFFVMFGGNGLELWIKLGFGCWVQSSTSLVSQTLFIILLLLLLF
jgi:hypothetical protein